jgi:hypothetical protein
MARAPNLTETSNDGMSWFAVAPFPAFNPLNWWALASPRNALLASLNNTRVALDAWRAASDGMRAIVRLQQDEALRMLAPTEADERPANGADKTAEEKADASAAAASLLVQPMIEATRAYGRVGRAFIVAQRDTIRAFADQPPN